MGAQTFMNSTMVAEPGEAFNGAVEQAQWDHGHGGYSGTLAEKMDYVIISTASLAKDEAVALAQKLMDDDDPRISDKWGPAGMIRFTDERHDIGWLIFGWASS